jgi:precorrin-3B synthase
VLALWVAYDALPEVRVPMPTAFDACPGVLVLHQARDGYVARIRLPGGYVTGRQWTALAGLAGEFGDGCLDLTARGNVQLRGLDQAAGAGLARRAAGAGLLPSGPHDRSRNITASPLAGLGGRPPLRRLVRALDAAIVADPVLTELPGRFLFAVDDGTGGAALAASDIGLRRTARQVELIIAGRTAGVRLPAGAAVPAGVTAARAAVAGGVGSQVTRIRDLGDGGASVAAATGGSFGGQVPGGDARLALGGQVPGGDARLALGPRGPAGREVVVVAAPLGRLTRAQLDLIGSLLRAAEVLRLAAAGRVVIPLAVPPPAALARLAASGLLLSDDHQLAGVTACSGLACSRALADVRALARPLPGHPRTHWAACPRSCGRPADAEVVVAAGPDSFRIAGRDAPARPLSALAGAS